MPLGQDKISNKDLDPGVKKLYLNLPLPSLKDNTGDIDRLRRALQAGQGLKSIRIPYGLIRFSSRVMREASFQVTATVAGEGEEWELLDISPGDTTKDFFGLALDLGTTRMVGALVDLRTGNVLSEHSMDNPQIRYGADILTRIHYAHDPNGLKELTATVREGIGKMVAQLATKAGGQTGSIYSMTVAGNTTMSHLFMGLDPRSIPREPYIPLVNRPDPAPARELEIPIHPNARVFIFPNVGSYFGGDLIAGLLASGLARRNEVSILVDVGTNAEVVLGNSDWLMACAGAAGPALEGGVAQMGMTAGDGAIDRVSLDRNTLRPVYSVIGGVAPLGICGSGLIDLAAELFSVGLLDRRGKFVPERDPSRFKETTSGLAYILVPGRETGRGAELVLTQADVDILLRSKAAMYTILATIIDSVGLRFQDLAHFYVAGTFGNYIDPVKAITLGMLPDLPLERYIPLGNSSLTGALQALCNFSLREETRRLCDRITYIEMNVNAEFMQRFNAARFIPHTDRNLFPSVSVP